MRGQGFALGMLCCLAGAVSAAPVAESLSAKALRRAHPIEPARLDEAKAAFAQAEVRFRALARQGLRADVQWMPDGMVMALGTNEYRLDGTSLRMREVRPNYVAVGDAARWCFLRTGEKIWLCETPGQLDPGLTRIDWAAVTRIRSMPEPCGENECTRWRFDGLVAVDPRESKPRKRRYHASTKDRGFSLSLLLEPDGTPRELLRMDRLSQYRVSSLTLKFGRDETIAPIEWPAAEQVAR